MKDKIYLSLDIDYWCRHSNLFNMERWIRKIAKLGVPVQVVIYHHNMLKHVNKFDCNVLWNIDYHSDLADFVVGKTPKRESPFNEGTWVNFVKFRNKAKFIWSYPELDCYYKDDLYSAMGRCDSGLDVFDRKYNPIDCCGWKSVSRRLERLPTDKDLKNVVAAGICISPEWIDDNQRIKAASVLNSCGLIGNRLYGRLIYIQKKELYHC